MPIKRPEDEIPPPVPPADDDAVKDLEDPEPDADDEPEDVGA